MSIFFSQERLSIAPNERQALALWRADAEEKVESGLRAWESLPVCSWRDFISGVWEELLLSRPDIYGETLLLNQWQQSFLWRKVLAESTAGSLLLNLPAAAGLASEAWQLSHAYQLTEKLQDPNAFWSEDTQVYLQWAEEYLRRCQGLAAIDFSMLETTLGTALKAEQLNPKLLPPRLELVGFAEWSPSQKSVLMGLKSLGIEISFRQVGRRPEQSWLSLAAPDSNAEISLAARWLREKAESGRGQLRLGLVLPDLRQRQDMVERIVSEHWQASSLLSLSTVEERTHDTSAGRALSSWPIVGDALKLLKVGPGEQELAQLQVLFNSPFIAYSQSESHERLLVWSKLLADRRHAVTLERLLERSLKSPHLARRLERLKKLLAKTHNRRRASSWAAHFAQVLDTLGWPGERRLNSSEHQTIERWKDCLAQFGTLDKVLDLLTREAALKALGDIAGEWIFQPKISRGSIEILGPLDAVGSQFDYLWLAGFDDATWPAPPRPNPYLPHLLQKQSRVPHSSPERELEFSRRVTSQLMLSATQGVVSCALHKDGKESRLSPLFRKLEPVEEKKLCPSPSDSILVQQFASALTETVPDLAPPLDTSQGPTRGGSNIFRDQACCPFRAFTHLRLKTRAREQTEPSLGPSERGTMLHKALEKLWQSLGSLAKWRQLSRGDQAAHLEACADFAVQRMRRHRPDALKASIVSLERRRLSAILEDWLEHEQSRDNFQVWATEKRIQFEFAGLELSATIDRIDKTDEGRFMLIDYKTGQVRITDWLGERPKEPQLPLYLLALEEEIHTLAFARLKRSKMGFLGLTKSDIRVPGVKDSLEAADGEKTWEQRKTEWAEHLKSLALEYRSGVSAVQPRDRQSCRTCRLQALCRIDEEPSDELQ